VAGVIGAADPDEGTGGLDVKVQVTQGQLADFVSAVDLQGELGGGLAAGGSAPYWQQIAHAEAPVSEGPLATLDPAPSPTASTISHWSLPQPRASRNSRQYSTRWASPAMPSDR
jgi:hypothetical protein